MATAESILTHQVVVFSLGGEDFALPIEQIKEVIRYTRPRSVTTNEAWVAGVISLRGMIVPVGDLSGRLGVSRADTEDAKIVIVETAAGIAGIIVDSVEEVLTIDGAHLDKTFGTENDIVRAIAKLEDRLLVLLDATELLHDSSAF